MEETEGRKSRRSALAKAAAALAAVTLACAGIASAVAYSTSEDVVENVLVVGNGDLAIEEEYDPPATLVAGAMIPKEVRVVNSGTVDCYVRMFCAFADSRCDACIYKNIDPSEYGAWDWSSADGLWYYYTTLAPGEETVFMDYLKVGSQASLDAAGIASYDLILCAESAQATDPLTGKPFASAAAAFAYQDSGA